MENRQGLSKGGKIILLLCVLFIALLFCRCAGDRVGEAIGTFLYNISH